MLRSWQALFQFPSNGKVLSDTEFSNCGELREAVPFPSNGKVLSDSPFSPISWKKMCFHSLPTGKSFRTVYFSLSGKVVGREFPFPSNGKVLSDSFRHNQGHSNHSSVSIPFKRESPFGHKSRHLQDRVVQRFPFPSNGKVLSDHLLWNCVFQRPERGFQFPSNGKVLSDVSS